MATGDKAQGVFSGETSIRDFLDPSQAAPVPIVELPKHLNPFASEQVRIFAKPMYLTPLFNIKLYGAWNLLMQAKREGKLDGVHTLVENSSGNMALAESVIGRILGIDTMQAIVPRDIAPGKLDLLRLFGVDPVLNSEKPGEQSGISRAREMGKVAGVFNPAQYENDANPSAYEQWLAPQIWQQLGRSMTLYCAGFGTTGTIVGSSRYFRREAPSVKIVGVACESDQPVPGVRSIARLKEIQFDWRSAVDEYVEVASKESFRKSLALCRTGIMGGPSSGFALAGLLKFLDAQKENGALDALRNKDGEVVAAFICPDSPLLYIDTYSTYLDPHDLA
ncbi:MAG TPA: pyridoxal-phosphate dependent enzyme [Candidatus Paceibacterota bacterium]|nr:pyridoxal-phosphate dependent enzyme [Candidatus Paceibacterota bacterium]